MRDLWISPHHAMYLEGVLIEARDLVNDVSVVQAERVEEVEYFHIELDSHDVIVAEGSLSETFVDDRSRGMFHNAHEYDALRKHPLPEDMLLIPGVVETTSNFVEHPEVVARRIEEAVRAVGERERVIASTDCGFGTFTRREWVIEPVVWLKLAAIRKGADIASARLWGRKSAA